MAQYILALDQGTTSSRAIVFGHDGRVVSASQEEFEQILPGPGVVEHDAEAIWTSQLKVARNALAKASLSAADIAAIGVTNQRETTILWDRRTGRPVANAVVWQSRVSAEICDRLKADGLEETFRRKTGLLLDPYFAGTKIKHLLERYDGLRSRTAKGEILFGTVDSWLIWRLTGGRRHVTDVSNACGAILGITRGTTAGHLARAAVESMAFQTCDVLSAMQKDAGCELAELKVDGGASLNDPLMQFQADLLNVRVQRPLVAETTALGAAYLAGLAVGYWQDTADVAANWALARRFTPDISHERREMLIRRWRKAVGRARDWHRHERAFCGVESKCSGITK